VLAVSRTAIHIRVTGVTCLTTAIGIGVVDKTVTIVVHTISTVCFHEDITWAAVHRAVAPGLSRIAKPVATAEREGSRVIADPRVLVAAGVSAVHVSAAAELTVTFSLQFPVTVGSTRYAILAVTGLADSITTGLRSVIADTIVRAAVTVFAQHTHAVGVARRRQARQRRFIADLTRTGHITIAANAIHAHLDTVAEVSVVAFGIAATRYERLEEEGTVILFVR
jgi:hypothetical protein